MKKWIAAARLRTLPLALGGIFLAASIASLDRIFNWPLFWLAIITSVSLQILSNFANDYGDFKKGTDQGVRSDRALASGAISPASMLKAIILFVVICLVSGVMLLFESFQSINSKLGLFFVVGLAAIAAAVKYTMGKNPYGYTAKGDIMVFVFFGLVSVWGTRYLFDQELTESFWLTILPAMSFGMLSAGVLNVNNIRDIESDQNTGKITLAVKWGKPKAERYQAFLLIGALILGAAFLILNHYYFALLLLPVPAFLLFRHQYALKKATTKEAYHKLLKKLVMISLIYTLIYFMQLFW